MVIDRSLHREARVFGEWRCDAAIDSDRTHEYEALHASGLSGFQAVEDHVVVGPVGRAGLCVLVSLCRMYHRVKVVAAEQIEHFSATRQLHGFDGDQLAEVSQLILDSVVSATSRDHNGSTFGGQGACGIESDQPSAA